MFQSNVSYPYRPLPNLIDCNFDYRFRVRRIPKYITISEYEYDYYSKLQESKQLVTFNSNGLIEKVDTLLNNHLKKISENPEEYSFSRLAHIIHYQPEKKYNKLEALTKYSGGISLDYDSDSRLIKHSCSDKFDGITYKEYEFNLTYENSVVSYNINNSTCHYKFDNDLLIAKTTFNNEKNYVTGVIKLYYENGIVKLIEQYSGDKWLEEEETFVILDKPKLEFLTNFFYFETENGLEVKQVVTDLDENTEDGEIYLFNKFNDLLSLRRFGENKKISSELNYDYTYDEFGNWINLEIYTIDDGKAALKHQISRDFQY